MSRKELEKKAKELGIDFDEEMEDDELEKLIEEAEDEPEDDDDDKDPAERIKYLEGELKKAIDRRDKAVKDRRKLSKQMKSLEDQIANTPAGEELDKLKKDLKDLRAFKKEKQKEEEERELENASELDKIKVQMQRKVDLLEAERDSLSDKLKDTESDFNKKFEDSKKEISKLRKKTLESDIISSASKYNAVRPNQIVKLVKSDFEYNEDTGEFIFEKRNKNGKLESELSVDEYVKEFLSDEDNENLVRSPAKGGFQTDKQKRADKKASNDKDKDKKKADKDELEGFDPEDEEIVRKADLEDMTPERYIKRVLVPQKKAQERVQKKDDTKDED